MRYWKVHKFVLIALLCGWFVGHEANAQMISVVKPGTKKRKIYTLGDQIYLKSRDTLFSGRLELISDTLLIIDDHIIFPSEITKVYDYSGRHFTQAAAIKFPIAGVGFFLLTTINRLANRNKPLFDDRNLYASGGLIGFGALMALFVRKKYDLTKKARLTILPE